MVRISRKKDHDKSIIGFGSKLALLAGFTSVLAFLTNFAQADNIGARALNKADQEYKNARSALQETIKRSKLIQDKRDRLAREYELIWQKKWEDKRLKQNAYDKVFNAQSENIRPLRQTVSERETELFKADQAAKTAKELLISMLEALQQEEKKEAPNSNLVGQLTAASDELREKWQKAQTDQTNARNALENARRILAERKELQEKELQELKAAIPEAPDAEISSTFAQRMDALPSEPKPSKVSELKAAEEEKANALFQAIVKNFPPYVSEVEVSYDGKLWYKASVEEDLSSTGTSSQTGPNAGQYEKALKDTNSEIELISRLISQTEARMRETREVWETESEFESFSRLAIELRNRNMAAFTLAIESSAVIAAAAFTGGAGGAALYGFFESIEKAGKLAWQGSKKKAMVALLRKGLLRNFNKAELHNLWLDAAKAANGKFYSELLLTGRSGVLEHHFSSTESESKNYFGLTNQESVVYGDAIETLLADGGSDVHGLVKGFWSKSALDVKAAKGLGITVAATATKLFAQQLTDSLNDDSTRAATAAYINAQTNRTKYIRLADFRDVLRADLQRYQAISKTLKTLIEHGSLKRKINITANNSIGVRELGNAQNLIVRVAFSRPLNYPPSLDVNQKGIKFGVPEKSENGGREWLFSPTSFDVEDKAEQLKLLISLNSNEVPHRYPDSIPQTPVQIASLNRYKLKNYEEGGDRNHILTLKKEEPGLSCAAPAKSAESDSSTITVGIVDREEASDCTYWGIPYYGVLALQQSGEQLAAEWIRTFSYQDLLNDIPDDATTDSNLKRVDFVKGAFFAAKNVSPKNADSLEFNSEDLWDNAGAGIFNGTISVPLRFTCGNPQTDGLRQAEKPLSSIVSVLFSPNEASLQPSSPGLRIAFNGRGMFERSVVKSWINDRGERIEIDGVKECGNERHFDFFDHGMILTGYPLADDQDPYGITPGQLHEYVKKLKNYDPTVEIAGLPVDKVLEWSVMNTQNLIDTSTRDYLYNQQLDKAIAEDLSIEHSKHKISAINQLKLTKETLEAQLKLFQ